MVPMKRPCSSFKNQTSTIINQTERAIAPNEEWIDD
jgi:hypothetical protein